MYSQSQDIWTGNVAQNISSVQSPQDRFNLISHPGLYLHELKQCTPTSFVIINIYIDKFESVQRKLFI